MVEPGVGRWSKAPSIAARAFQLQVRPQPTVHQRVLAEVRVMQGTDRQPLATVVVRDYQRVLRLVMGEESARRLRFVVGAATGVLPVVGWVELAECFRCPAGH
jgi:hypothetical protein